MSDQNISPANMRAIAQAMENKADLMRAVQAIIEGVPIGASSLDNKIVGTWEGVSFIERQLCDDRLTYNGQVLRRHRNGGGWVPLEQDEHDPTKPFVAETAYVGPFAMVLDNARVLDDAYVYGGAWVSGNARVLGDAWVFGNARVFDNAWVLGNARVFDNAQVCGDAWVSGGLHETGRIDK